MKRKIIASIIGIAASSALVASSYGQGEIQFANYTFDPGTPSAPVTFGSQSGGLAGELVGSEFTAELEYDLGTQTAGSFVSQGFAQNFAGGTAVATFYGTDGNAGSQAGEFLFIDPSPGAQGSSGVTVPTYSSGAVTFEVFVTGTKGAITYNGFSSPVVVSALTSPPGDLFYNNTGITANPMQLSAFTVNPVPEPTTLALAGLGMASMLVIRRRK